jgi:hypothetical protein
MSAEDKAVRRLVGLEPRSAVLSDATAELLEANWTSFYDPCPPLNLIAIRGQRARERGVSIDTSKIDIAVLEAAAQKIDLLDS